MLLGPLPTIHHQVYFLQPAASSFAPYVRSVTGQRFVKRRRCFLFRLSSMETTEKPLQRIGVDDSPHSFYALKWTLDQFFSTPGGYRFKLVIVYARPSTTSFVGFVRPVLQGFLIITLVETDLKKKTLRVVEQPKQMCTKKSVDVTVNVMEGDPRNAILEAIEKHQASMLVVGSHGYGALRRVVHGAISDY